MLFQKLFQPALYIMSKLSFKAKIIASISLLFILLLLPSRTLFTDYVQKNNRYEQQLIGLQYIEMMNAFVKTIQVHRTLSLHFLKEQSKENQNREALSENEEKFYHQKQTIMNFDEQHFKLLSSDQNFAKAIALFETLKIENFDKITKKNSTFEQHSKIITKLFNTIKTISNHTAFSSSKDLRINYLASMLKVKLPLLRESTRQLGDTTFSKLNNNQKIKQKELILHSTVLDLKSLKEVLKNNYLISDLDNYHALEEQVTQVTHGIENLIYIIKYSIVLEKQIDTPYFFQNINTTIEMQEDLYRMFNQSYQDTINELANTSKAKLWSLLVLFFIIVLIAFYLFIAFYQSITSNLKKLQKASEMITEGQTQIKLQVDKPDEIGDALIAFNIMSEKLSENISFLNGYKTAIDTSSIVSKTDLKGVITYVNKMFCDVSGYTEEELLGRSHNIIRHPKMEASLFKEMWQTIQDKKIWKGTLQNRHRDGSAYTVNATILPILDSENNILEYVAVRHDITELEKSKEEIKKQRTDLLTGLNNRNQLLEDLKGAIKPIIFYMNIDNFSGFNDFYGSDIGDLVLIDFANRLKDLQERERFKLYKLQADRFILLFQEDDFNTKNFQNFFADLFEEVEKEISEIHLENQNSINISITAGVASYYSSDNYQNLILYADIARKKAQEHQKKFLIFEHNMRKSEDYAQNIEWIKKIKEAIIDDRISTYYQPIVNNKTGKITKYETLVRMLDHEGIPVSTFIFLTIAQKAKIYPQITKIVIEKALKTFENRNDIEFSINLTVEDILSKDITNFIYKKLENYPNAKNVIFEITESEEVSDYKLINNFIDGVNKYGVRIAIDDFGSGYANFDHIMNINADFIKIDGTLIKDITTDKNAAIITEAIISFSKKLGKKTITEYVHSEEVYKMVKKLGADYSQGFYFGEALPELK